MHDSTFLSISLLLWTLLELSLFLRNRYRIKERKEPAATVLIAFSFLSAIGVSVYAILFEVGFLSQLTVIFQIIGGMLFLLGFFLGFIYITFGFFFCIIIHALLALLFYFNLFNRYFKRKSHQS